MQKLNIVDTAIRSGIFQTFTRLLEDSALEQRLRGAESFTLFAPVDSSFAYLSPGMFADLLSAENEGELSNVLGYHVVLGKLMFRELRALSKAPTVCGLELTINNTVDLRLGGAKLLYADILACNGVIHGIDRLLLPVKSGAATSGKESELCATNSG